MHRKVTSRDEYNFFLTKAGCNTAMHSYAALKLVDLDAALVKELISTHTTPITRSAAQAELLKDGVGSASGGE